MGVVGRSSLRPSIAPGAPVLQTMMGRVGSGTLTTLVHPCTVSQAPHLALVKHWLIYSSHLQEAGAKRAPISRKRNPGLTHRLLWAPLPGGVNREEAFHRSRWLLHRRLPTRNAFPSFLQRVVPACPSRLGSKVTSSWKPPQTLFPPSQLLAHRHSRRPSHYPFLLLLAPCPILSQTATSLSQGLCLSALLLSCPVHPVSAEHIVGVQYNKHLLNKQLTERAN